MAILETSLCLRHLRKFSRWITALSVHKFPFLEVPPYSHTKALCGRLPCVADLPIRAAFRLLDKKTS